MASTNGQFMDFSGKVVLITGAATGIGRAVALGFARRGAKLAIGRHTCANCVIRHLARG
jgi:NAD(P)-dependent dehydrogenase (short-subunit alcohol dehydrogenase family)